MKQSSERYNSRIRELSGHYNSGILKEIVELYNRFYKKAFLMFFKDEALAHDKLWDILESVMSNYETIENKPAYIWRSLDNSLKSYTSAHSKFVKTELAEDNVADQEHQIDEKISIKMLFMDVFSYANQTFCNRYAEIFIKWIIEGKGTEEISEELGITVPHVRQNKSRIRAKLRRKFGSNPLI